MFPYKAAIFGLVSQSLALKPTELPEHYFIFIFIFKNNNFLIECIKIYTITLENYPYALEIFVAPKGFEPLLTENQNLARYLYAKGLFYNQNVKEQFVI